MTGQSDPRVPGWAQLLNAPQFARFVDVVEAALHGQPWSGEIASGQIELRTPEGGPRALGLATLVQICRQAPADDWPEVVASHFATVFGAQRAEDQAIEARVIADFERAKPALRVRLWSAQLRDEVGAENMVGREDLPGVVTALVLDLPWSVRTLRPQEVAAWGVPIDELFAIALDNVQRRCPPEVERVERDGVPPTVFLTSADGDFFAASHALLLERHAGAVGQHGALVGVPHRHMVVAHPIEDLRVIDAVNMLLPFVRRCFDEGPGSVDPDLFWYRDGRFVRLPCETDARGALHFAPPEEFSSFVGGLREER